MPPRRTRNINDVYERIMARMDERLDQFVDQFSNRMNDMMNLRRCDDYEGALVFDDDYEEAPIFDDDQFEEESMPVYDTDIEDVISEEEENMEDIVVVANDLCSSMIQTTLSLYVSAAPFFSLRQMVTTRRNSDDDVPNFEAMITAAVANALPNLIAALRLDHK
ncbi:hypothetical protein Tco_0718314 [Tanacetum coccineum]